MQYARAGPTSRKEIVLDALARRCVIELGKLDPLRRSVVMGNLALAQEVGAMTFSEIAHILGAGRAIRELMSTTYLECPLCGWIDKEGGDEYCPCGCKMMVRG